MREGVFVMDYRVITAASEYKLREQVVGMIKLGWRPQGGVSFVYHGVSGTWAQAMVREDK